MINYNEKVANYNKGGILEEFKVQNGANYSCVLSLIFYQFVIGNTSRN